MRRVIQGLLSAPSILVDEVDKVAPKLVERGRVQMANARMMGEFTVRMSEAEASRRIGGLQSHLRDVLAGAGLVPRQQSDFERDPVAPPVVAEAIPMNDPVDEDDVLADAPEPDELALADYDSLAASQVVPRLAALDPAELEAVRSYEIAHRGRKTVLGRIAQLQG